MYSIRDLCNPTENEEELKPDTDIEMESSSHAVMPQAQAHPLPFSTPPRPHPHPHPHPHPKYGAAYSAYESSHPNYSHYPQASPHSSLHRSPRHPSHQYSNHYQRVGGSPEHYGHYPQYGHSPEREHEIERYEVGRSLLPPQGPHYYDSRSSHSSSSHHSRQHHHKTQAPNAYQNYQYVAHLPHPQDLQERHNAQPSRKSKLPEDQVTSNEKRRSSEAYPSTSARQEVIKAEVIPKGEGEVQASQPNQLRNEQKEREKDEMEEEDLPISKARIKIVQQPLHARMCGFGEKDRRPIDPPPIVQLILDDDPTYDQARPAPKPVKPIMPKKRKYKTKGKPGRKPGKKTQETVAVAADVAAEFPAKKQEQGIAKNRDRRQSGEFHSIGEEESRDEESDGEEAEEDELADDEDHEMTDAAVVASERVIPSTPSQPVPKLPKRRGRPPREKNASVTGSKHSRDGGLSGTESETEWPVYEGGAAALRVDPLFILHVSLWSEDGTDVRSMISNNSHGDQKKLTRILMGSIVVSPLLLNNEHGKPGWYFSFPDLSVRTEGTYTLKFSLTRFGSFDFNDSGGSHASTIIAEEISEPFSVYSAKKFPGMTESTNLSKTFAKQGVKIPIRNDLRIRKNTDKDDKDD
ncbi:hypothetical protein BGZ76_011184 [Entomortierella beljakovae]|nr:hypothetical protein BGZ76_011184 [Entomortierella beljakovae]